MVKAIANGTRPSKLKMKPKKTLSQRLLQWGFRQQRGPLRIDPHHSRDVHWEDKEQNRRDAYPVFSGTLPVRRDISYLAETTQLSHFPALYATNYYIIISYQNSRLKRGKGIFNTVRKCFLKGTWIT